MEITRVVILNGKTADEPAIRTALDELVSDGVRSSIRITADGGDAERFTAEAVRAGVEQIIVFGGDGTLNRVAAGVDSATTTGSIFRGEIGIVPAGTANDFATCAGIPDDPSEAVAAMRGYRTEALDIGWGSDGPFLNVVTAGFGSEISSGVSEKLKSVLGRISYLVAGAANVGDAKPRQARIRAPDFDRSLGFYLLAIGNGRCAGGGVPVCPDANPADGLFDVTIVPEGAVGFTIGEIFDKGLEGVGDAGIRFRCPWLEIESEQPLQLNLDGEPSSGTKFRFEVRPGALRVLLPADCPMLMPREVSPSRSPSDRCAPEPKPA